MLLGVLHFCNTPEGSQTYSLSFWSCGSLRPWHTSVSFLSLFSWGSNKTNKTWVSLLSLGTRISTQTRQPRRPLKLEEKRRRGWRGGEGSKKSNSSCTYDRKTLCYLTIGPGGPFCPAGPGAPCSPWNRNIFSRWWSCNAASSKQDIVLVTSDIVKGSFGQIKNKSNSFADHWSWESSKTFCSRFSRDTLGAHRTSFSWGANSTWISL